MDPTSGYHRFSIFFRVILLLAVWTGPIPYCHSHGTLVGAETTCSGYLINHLQAFHTDAPLFANVDFGWHVHFSVPTNSEEDEPTQTKWLSNPCSATTVSASLQGLRSLDPWIFPACNLTLGQSKPAAHAVKFFFEDYAPSLALPLRLGVIRC